MLSDVIVKLAPALTVYVIAVPIVPPDVFLVRMTMVFAVTVVLFTVTVPAISVALPAR